MNDFSKQMEMVLYQTDDGDVSVNAYIIDETLWVTQKAMAELFGVGIPAISKHLANIYEEGELDQAATISKMETVQSEGNRNVRREVVYYNLDAVISVGYRVNSKKATQFRIWATKVLKEYMQKGFVLDDDRLKQGKTAFGKDYFRELLERVRSIRASERRIWQQITDIFAECSIDYTKDSEVAYHFYATIQNKFHYAITNQTAAEIVYSKADHTKEHMGLTTWKNSPDGRILKSDVATAKNYLDPQQLLEIHTRRAQHILNVAAYHKADILVLGAFGCGAFENDPSTVAQAYRAAMQDYQTYFDVIEFAVFCRESDTTNYSAFEKVFHPICG